MQTNTKTPLQFVVSYEVKQSYTDEATWIADVGNAYELYQSSGWNLVNVLAKGVNDLRSRADKSTLYQRVHEQYPNLSVKRMQNLASLARKPYAKQAQDLGLEIAHVEAVLGLSDDEAEALLLDAAEQSLSANAIGGIIRERRMATVQAPNAFVPAVGNDSADDEPPFARTKGNALYDDDLDATAERLAGSAAAYDYTPDSAADIDDYQFSGYEFSDLLERGAEKLRKYAATDEQWHRQRTITEWLKIVDRLLY